MVASRLLELLLLRGRVLRRKRRRLRDGLAAGVLGRSVALLMKPERRLDALPPRLGGRMWVGGALLSTCGDSVAQPNPWWMV